MYIYIHSIYIYYIYTYSIYIYTHTALNKPGPGCRCVAAAGWGFISPDNTEDSHDGSLKMAEHMDVSEANARIYNIDII